MAKAPAKLPTLDLHGRKTDEVYDLLDDFIRRQSERGIPRARVMTGKGEGKVRSLTIEYLRQARYPWQYEKLNNDKPNEGVLIVFLD